jgi:hypothetical protein
MIINIKNNTVIPSTIEELIIYPVTGEFAVFVDSRMILPTEKIVFYIWDRIHDLTSSISWIPYIASGNPVTIDTTNNTFSSNTLFTFIIIKPVTINPVQIAIIYPGYAVIKG